ncbi:hypothetical protein T08_13359 [Trichinella sp. T8]|nr:hypothetical protein T08_13359 [Trichinella sp. T8]
MSNYWAHAWYLFETLKEFTSMYSGHYSKYLKNYGELQNNFTIIPSNCAALKVSLFCVHLKQEEIASRADMFAKKNAKFHVL